MIRIILRENVSPDATDFRYRTIREQSARAGDEVHRLQAELATAKRIGAAEELRRLADEWRKERPGWIHQCNVLCYRAAELEGKNAV